MARIGFDSEKLGRFFKGKYSDKDTSYVDEVFCEIIKRKNYSIGDSNHTVCPYTYTDGFKVNAGASERHLFNIDDCDKSYTVIPIEASGIPTSEFYLSLIKTYLDGKFNKDSFTENAAKAAAKYTLILLPVDK